MRSGKAHHNQVGSCPSGCMKPPTILCSSQQGVRLKEDEFASTLSQTNAVHCHGPVRYSLVSRPAHRQRRVYLARLRPWRKTSALIYFLLCYLFCINEIMGLPKNGIQTSGTVCGQSIEVLWRSCGLSYQKQIAPMLWLRAKIFTSL